MTAVETGRVRQQACLDFLDTYKAATTLQLACLLWRGNQRLASRHLLRFHEDGHLARFPHPLIRHGPYVYTRTGRNSAHSQKILHHLASVDCHIAITRHLGKHGARVIPELPWGRHLIPDQTVLWRDSVWAVEHHLSGQFSHSNDYRSFMEEEAYEMMHWYRRGMRIGLLVVTSTRYLDHVQRELTSHKLKQAGLSWKVGSRENVLKDPLPWLQVA